MFGNLLTSSEEAKQEDVLLGNLFLFFIAVDSSYYIV